MENMVNGKQTEERGGGFLKDNRGLATVEIILIVVVLISLVILFKGQLTSLVTDILEKIATQSNTI